MIVTATTIRIAEEEVDRLQGECSRVGAMTVSRHEVDDAEQSVREAQSEVQKVSGSPLERVHGLLSSLCWRLRLVFSKSAEWSGIPEELIAFFLGIVLIGLALLFLALVGGPPLPAIIASTLAFAVCVLLLLAFLWLLPAAEARRLLERHEEFEEVRAIAIRIPKERLEAALADHARLRWLWDLRQRYQVAKEELQRLLEKYNERKNRLLSVNWRSLRGIDFEQFLVEVFETLGFVVQTTKASGDQGVDLLATKGIVRIAIQAKGYAASVGNAAVQEAYAGMAFYNCTRCAVITNSEFTNAARELAAKTGCVLIDGALLPRLIGGQIF